MLHCRWHTPYKMKYQHCLWFLYLLNHCASTMGHEDYERTPLGAPVPARPGKSMRKMVAGATLSRKNTINYQVNKLKIIRRVIFETYCKSTYDATEAEVLLNLDMDAHSAVGNWWEYKVQNFVWRKMPNPRCSRFPNKQRPSAVKLDEHEFFEYAIHIPAKEGVKVTRLTTYEFFKYTPAWKDFMECDCSVREGFTSAECVDGKISFSRGVGGDSSFFVHVPVPKDSQVTAPEGAASFLHASEPPNEYRVVAHICF